MGNDRLAKAVQLSESMEQYDGYARNLLSYKELIAVILKAVGHEFREMSIKEIKDSIDADPEIETGRIVGGGVCYAATLLSGQLEKEIESGDYDQLKKVYSIWICMNAPEKDANTVTEYRILPKDVYGRLGEYGRYDLVSVIMIRLPNHEPEEAAQEPVEKMLAALYTIFKAQKAPEEKCKELKYRYGIQVSTEFEKEVTTMCNFSEAILEQGIEQGIEQGDLRAIRKMLERGYALEEIAQIYEKELIERVLKETTKV